MNFIRLAILNVVSIESEAYGECGFDLGMLVEEMKFSSKDTTQHSFLNVEHFYYGVDLYV